jgi:hypothetical protein
MARRVARIALVALVGGLLGLIAPFLVVEGPAPALIVVSAVLGALIFGAIWQAARF